MSKRKEDVAAAPATYESRAFFAAMMAAVKGDDAVAAAILRDIADKMTEEFKPKTQG